jgi:hypothetical protein
MGHIFISYSHKDSEYAYKLATALTQKGFDVWIDKRIDYGTVWPKVIQKHLDECDAFIVVVSENSSESRWVQNEVARAEKKDKPIFPLLLDGEPWISTETTQYLDVRGEKLPPSKFYDYLSRVMSNNKVSLPSPITMGGRQPKVPSSTSSGKRASESVVQGSISISGNVVIKHSKVAGRDISEVKAPDIHHLFAPVYVAIKKNKKFTNETRKTVTEIVKEIEERTKKGDKASFSLIDKIPDSASDIADLLLDIWEENFFS